MHRLIGGVGGRIVQFAVLGKKVNPLEEEPDADLPGGPADCHLTDRIVLVGHTSSGDLTAGVDTESGLTGDCFRLVTEWGQQYRVEVKFGDTESVDIGGSVWIVYTGSDFDGMSSLGSAVDHNREDGRSFTDFKHNNSTVKSYFVDVAAYDLYSTPYSTNSLTYNGPYTITMTDITGVKRMVENLAPGATSAPNENIRLGSGNTKIDLATQFTTGSYPFGYQLDRIRVPFHTIAASGASPLISIHRDSSGDPGAKLCDIAVPTKIVESARTHGGYPPPYDFLAPDCAHNLTASTPYWIVFSDVDYVEYLPEVTDDDTEHAYGSGWIIGNTVKFKRQHLNSWSAGEDLTIRFELWAEPKGPPNATGYPLIQGRFAVGQTLTAHPNNIADPDGLNEPEYTYQWVLLIKELVDLGIELEIQGATDRTYTVTGIAAGDRLKVRASFSDAAGNAETRTSPESSHIAPRTTSLISNLGRNTEASPTNSVGLSTGFIAGAEGLKYRVATAQVDFPATGAPGLTQDAFKFRLFSSTTNSELLNRKPTTEIAAFTNPVNLTSGGRKTFEAPAKALLSGGATYHVVMTAGGSGDVACDATDHSTPDTAGTLPDWLPILRTYHMATESAAANTSVDSAWCKFKLDGYLLADAPHITSLDITSNTGSTTTYNTGDTIEVAVTLSEAVTFTGPDPVLPIMIGADNREALYDASQSNTTKWVFRYTLQPGDESGAVVTIKEHALRAYAAADLSHNAITVGYAPPPNAAGQPSMEGRLAIAETLTADVTGISDPDGPANPDYTYQWIRVDADGAETEIAGATNNAYTVDAADAGNRLMIRVVFIDDDGTTETLTSPATSYVPPATRILIKKSGQINNRDNYSTVGLSQGFYTAAGDLKHRIESVRMSIGTTHNINTDLFRFRLFTSTSASATVERKPAVEIATFTNPARVAAGSKKFTAPTEALLAGGTTYHIVMYTGGTGQIRCASLGSSQAHDGSLPNWELIQRTNILASENAASNTFFSEPCDMRIYGYQLADAPYITSLEITSTPNTSPSYDTGEAIRITATLSEAVNFSGPEPVLSILIGDNTRDAAYVAGMSTATSWVFQYTVQDDDRDDDGIRFGQHALRAYADADLSHNAISTDAGHRVNAHPLLRSIRVTSKPEAPNWYGPGETIQFTAEFSMPITVTGDPEFAFSITSGGSTRALATYISATENRVVFEYTVSTTDDDSDGIWIGDHTDTLRLDGDDTIVGAHNARAAVLDHQEVGKLASHRIDQNPRIVTVALTSDPTHGADSDTYAPGEIIEFTATSTRRSTWRETQSSSSPSTPAPPTRGRPTTAAAAPRRLSSSTPS